MKKTGIIFISIMLMFLLTSCNQAVVEEITSLQEEKKELEIKMSNFQKDLDRITDENQKLKNENSALTKFSEKYKDLSDSEIAAQTESNNLKAEKAKLETEKLKKEKAKAEKEAKAKARAEKEAKEKKGYNTGITFSQLARNPDTYEGEKVKFYGRVIQVLDGDEVNLRIAVNDDYNNVILVYYQSDIVYSRVLEDDYITIYGVSEGLHTYESTLGSDITIPLIKVDRIDQ